MRSRRLILVVVGLCLLLVGTSLLVTPVRSFDGWGAYLPFLTKEYPANPLLVTGAWTTDAVGNPDTSFVAGDVVVYYGTGTSSAEVPVEAELSWFVEGTCGRTLLFSETVMLDPGTWTAVLTQTAPGCSGVLDYIFQSSFRDRPLMASAPMTVINPVTVVVSDRQAFDKCDNPSISQMQTWWTYSPYWIANIYIGGVHRACANLDLTPAWVRAVLAQGWTLIPTWVGPQAPCSAFTHKISYDPVVSYQQGQAEADAAAAVASGLGLTSYGPGQTIIYYDLEGYPGGSNPACRTAVNAFVDGWVSRMHALGNPAGMYGGACSSYISTWATIPHVPDDIWAAAWYTDDYDPDATVWGLPCVSNNLWENNQRIRQYAGDHHEVWGGLNMTIDSNIALGQVLGLLPTGDGVGLPHSNILPLTEVPVVHSLGMVSPEQVWALLDGHLFWTGDSGLTWAEIDLPEVSVQAVYFLDAAQGWLVSGPFLTSLTFQLWHTRDGGMSWQGTGSLPVSEMLLDAHVVGLDFISSQEGWLSLRLASSSNFNLGSLFHTIDGGLTWEELSLPGGGAIDFLDSHLGWTWAGPQGDLPYQTLDGGLTWHPVEVIPPGVLSLPAVPLDNLLYVR